MNQYNQILSAKVSVYPVPGLCDRKLTFLNMSTGIAEIEVLRAKRRYKVTTYNRHRAKTQLVNSIKEAIQFVKNTENY